MPRSDTFETLQVPSELEQMVALYRQERPARVLEIGCWDGGTLKVWLQEAEPELVVAVDLWHRNSDAYEEWRKPATVLRLFTGQSQEQDQVGSMQAHAPYDWAFVDGDHGDWGAREDVRNVLPLVRPGGLDRKSTRLNSSHIQKSRMPSSA